METKDETGAAGECRTHASPKHMRNEGSGVSRPGETIRPIIEHGNKACQGAVFSPPAVQSHREELLDSLKQFVAVFGYRVRGGSPMFRQLSAQVRLALSDGVRDLLG